MFRKATKQDVKLRMALCGPAGAGKTWSALELAKNLGGETLLIDTESGSSEKYADDFDFFVEHLRDHNPQNYINLLERAASFNIKNVIIDSLSHSWNGKNGALELVDKASKKYKGNNFVSWRDVTPLYNKMLDAIISSPFNVIATLRTKTEYLINADEKGKNKVEKIGTAPILRAGVEYEFDIVGDLDLDHNLVINKTRCSTLDGAVINRPGEEFANTVKEWLCATGDAKKNDSLQTDQPFTKVGASFEAKAQETATTTKKGITEKSKQVMFDLATSVHMDTGTFKDMIYFVIGDGWNGTTDDLTVTQAQDIVDKLGCIRDGQLVYGRDPETGQFFMKEPEISPSP